MDESPPVADEGRPQRRTAAGLPAASWAYVGVAIVVALLWIVARRAPGNISAAEFYSPLTIVTAFASVLVGAAFHARHPDAWSGHRPIAVAIGFSAAAGVLFPVGTILLWYGMLAAPFGGRGPAVIEWAFAVGVVASILLMLSTALLWIGIRRARRQIDGPGVRGSSIGIWALAGFVLLSSTPAVVFNLGHTTFDQRVYILWSLGSSAIESLLSAGVTVTLVAGALSGESPRRAWWVSGVSRVIVLVGSLVYPALALVIRPFVSGAIVYIVLVGLIGLIGALGLLAGFALGLPSDDCEGPRMKTTIEPRLPPATTSMH
jgi:hypothetical protein